MYSLYRAWLSLGPPSGAPLPVLQDRASGASNSVVPTRSEGAPDVSLQVGPTMTQFSAHRTILAANSGFFKAVLLNHTGPSPIPVPNVSVDEFSSLLTFMYTGYLDLNFTNIYNTLLATHILHMPRALELCRSFLVQNHPLDMRPAPIIKPIPSRKTAMAHPQIFAPVHNADLPKSEVTPFRSVERENSGSVVEKEMTAIENTKVESKTRVPTEKSSSEKLKPAKRRESSNHSDHVIVDIACCDGPVRFHRVLNKNYGLKTPDVDNRVREIDRNVLLNRVMNENIRDQRGGDAENNLENSASANTEVFTCVYCNHTFKSQYCYQKHARRHLNPVSLEPKATQKLEATAPSGNSAREVKLLDMNVQYYPCKTCGSKFPSYYFVHKHRKMCHADEVGEQQKGQKSEAVVAVAVVEEKNERDGEGEGGDSSSEIEVDSNH